MRGKTDTLHALRGDPAIAAAERNAVRRVFAAPNDLLFAKGPQRHYLGLIRMPAAWDTAGSPPPATIAIVDTGVDLDHPDLAGRILPGRDFVNDDTDASDDEGHGTMVAGIAAASPGNSIGVAGAAGNARILPVKVMNAGGWGTDADIAEGITWAVDRDADVVNLSLGGGDPGETLRAAVQYAVDRDVLVVAASGNDGYSEPSYPAAFPGVLAVGATDWSGNVVWWSNYGSWVDMVAPGFEITSTKLAAGSIEAYEAGYGTSFSSPLVAGVAALVRAKNPTWTQQQVAEQLTGSARDAGPRGVDDFYGHGLLDAYAALGGPKPSPVRAPAGDALEPNGTIDRATPVTDPYFTSATISPQGDVDWFAKDVTAAGTIRFQIESSYAEPYAEAMYPAAQAFGTRLQPLGRPVRGVTSNTWVTIDAPQAGRYFVKVWNDAASRSRLAPGTPWGYTVKVTVEAAQPVSRFEPFELLPLGPSVYSSAVADVTGDGRDDVLATSLGSRELSVYRQRPDGYLAQPETHALHPTHSSVNLPISTGDANGDGTKDVAVAFSSGGSVSGVDVLYGGAALSSPVLAYGATDMAEAEFGDVDRDGRSDLVVASASRGIQVLRSTGPGFAAPTTVATRGGNVEVGDLNADGRTDIAACCSYVFETQKYYVDVHLQQAGGGYTTQTYLFGGPAPPGGMAIGDVTGDGLSDLVMSEPNNQPNGRIVVFPQTAGGALATPVRYAAYDLPRPVEIADVNADGRGDVVTGHDGWERAGVYLQSSSGTLAAEELYGTIDQSYHGESSLGVGDVNGDGKPDLTLADTNFGVDVLRQVSSTWPPPGWARDTQPADNSEGAPASVAPSIRFARALQTAAVSATTIRLENAETGAAVGATVSYDAVTRLATVRPSASLPAGAYRVSVSGVKDASGASMDEAFSFRFMVGSTLDSTPPETTITYALWGGDYHETGFDFISSEPGSRFECSVDAGSWNACDTPLVYAWLAEGSRTIRVRAIDAAGNVDATPASRSWTMPPTNDNFASRQTLTGQSGTLVTTSVQATQESGEPAHGPISGARSIWFRWTAPVSGPIAFDTYGSEFNTVVAVYTGTAVSSLTPVASNDDAAGTEWSRVVVDAVAGTTYAIAIDGSWGIARGTATLTWGQPSSVDLTPPEQNPTIASTHPSGWSSDNTVDVTWAGASDSGSGVDGFSYDWTQGATTTPDAVKDAEETAGSATSPSLGDGEWWFHLRTVDNAGNWTAPAHLGPFRIDTAVPANPVLASGSHAPGIWSTDATVDASWSGASDAHSGVDGFSFAWTQAATTTPDVTKDAEETASSTTSPPLGDGDWWLHLRTRDNAGNWSATTHLGPFRIDTTAPSNPTVSSTHSSGWSTDNTVDAAWSGAEDGASGVDGFSFAWTQESSSAPDTTKDAEETVTGATSQPLGDGEWWFHLRTRDNAGNWSGPVHLGPFRVDRSVPANPTLSSSSHTPGAWSNDPTVEASWSGASDTHSGVDGFSYAWTQQATSAPDEAKDAEEGTGSTTSPTLADGDWWFHLRTRDNAGNWSGAVHIGPFRIDTVAPTNPTVSSPSHQVGTWSSNSTVIVQWGGNPGESYSYEWSASDATEPDSVAEGSSTRVESVRPDGVSWFHLRTRSDTGAWSHASHFGPFLVDTAPPATTITSGPSGSGTSTSATFAFTSEGGAAFECSLDGAPFTPCVSPVTYPGVAPGDHVFRARATDRAGNVEPVPAERRWSVEAPPPPDPTPPPPPPPVPPPASLTPPRAGQEARCVVPRLKGRRLPYVRAAVKRSGCRLGRVGRAHSPWTDRGRVISQAPRAGRRLPRGTQVAVVVSLGKKPAPRRR